MNPRAERALENMKRNLHRRITVGELAQSVGLSSSRLTHLFTHQYGMPPAKYLRTLRLQKASMLLETTLLSIKEIAGQVGYYDGYHFARDFKRATGLTPSEFRNRNWSLAHAEEKSPK
jgi:transcriptional regulator GlxA family with amidase domain